MPAQKFDFQAYTVQQLEGITKKLDNLGAIYMPNEIANLRFTEINKSLAETMRILAEHTSLLSALKGVDDKQQGSMDTSRRIQSAAFAALGLIVAALSVYVIWKVGVTK
jgi:hypothetical protein